MNRQVLARRIKNAGSEVHRLAQCIVALESVNLMDCPDNYSRLSHQTALRAEGITQSLRRLVFGTTNILKTDYHVAAAQELDIHVTEDADIVNIKLPCLIPKRNKWVSNFITDPLYAVLEKFVSERPLPFEPFLKCVVCITHIYDKSLFTKGRVCDHDNIELKGILDVINTFLLTDDGGMLCDIFNTSEYGEMDMVQISVMKKHMFPEWLMQHKKCA